MVSIIFCGLFKVLSISSENGFRDAFEGQFQFGCQIAAPNYTDKRSRIAHDERCMIAHLSAECVGKAVPIIICCLAAGGENYELYGQVLDDAEKKYPGIESFMRHWCRDTLTHDWGRYKTQGVKLQCCEHPNFSCFWNGRPVRPVHGHDPWARCDFSIA